MKIAEMMFKELKGKEAQKQARIEKDILQGSLTAAQVLLMLCGMVYLVQKVMGN